MKAVILLANQQMKISEVEQQLLADDHCRIRIMNAGVCSSDIHRSQDNGAYFYPLIIGHEFAGEIIQIGSNIKHFKVGDRVGVFPLLPCFKCEACDRFAYMQCRQYSYYGSRQDGAYAEYLDIKEWNLIKLPDDISFSDAAALEPMSVVVHALKKSKLLEKKEETSVAIIGAGFLGLLMAQILKVRAPKCKISIFDRNDFKLAIARKYVNQTYHLQNDEAWQDYFAREGKNQFEFVVEATGIPAAFNYSIEAANYNGKVIWLGNITDQLVMPKHLVSLILRKELSILGTWNSDYIPHQQDDWKDSLQLMQKGIRPSELVTQWVSLEEIPEILKKLYEHKKGIQRFESIKVMIENQKKEIA